MSSQKEVYASHADQYERLISREDHQRNILPALQKITSFAGLDVIDLGAGTGRLSSLLAPVSGLMGVFDSSPHMLAVARQKLIDSGLQNWYVATADHRRLPLEQRSVDVIVSGWSICYLVTWYRQTWEQELKRALAEMERVLRPGGNIIILETLGTGHKTPHIGERLADYFGFLEKMGFQSTWIRTDFRFESLAEAEALTDFFFGEELARQVVDQKWVTLPECTGIWWLTLPG